VLAERIVLDFTEITTENRGQKMVCDVQCRVKLDTTKNISGSIERKTLKLFIDKDIETIWHSVLGNDPF
jgi:hypothetical protein